MRDRVSSSSHPLTVPSFPRLPPPLQSRPPSALSPSLSGAREPARPPYHARRGAAPPPARRPCVSAVCCDWTRSAGPGSEGGVSRGCGGVSDLTGPGRPSSFPPPPRKDEPPSPLGLPTFGPCSRTLFKLLGMSRFLFPLSLQVSLPPFPPVPSSSFLPSFLLKHPPGNYPKPDSALPATPQESATLVIPFPLDLQFLHSPRFPSNLPPPSPPSLPPCLSRG